jgi:hypothetical protein|nr:MAG TPA: Minor capsid protein from bacteriophage [Caudoviricetes sp.]DAO94294.1 MAG TPA: Minor capsid protein from bacteriophage [Caudoviricetes sp.]
MAEKEQLTVTDAGTAMRGLLELVLKYPDYPEGFAADNSTVKCNDINPDRSIGLFPLQGAVYLEKYVSGSYEAQVPFQMAYRCSPDTNTANIDAQDLLDKLAAWMEQSRIGFQDNHIQMESINRTSPVGCVEKNEKCTTYAINMQLKYFYKK